MKDKTVLLFFVVVPVNSFLLTTIKNVFIIEIVTVMHSEHQASVLGRSDDVIVRVPS